MKTKLVLLGCCLIPSISNAVVIIDSFSAGELTLTSPATVIQEALSTATVASGNRRVILSNLNSEPLEAHINTTAGEFDFQSESFGYFTLIYTFAPSSEINLRGDGGNAFLLNFSDVTPGLWRGSYHLQVDGVSVSFTEDFLALNGPGSITIPFSRFTSETTFAPTTIKISGGRIEPDYRIALTSITTIPEPATLTLAALSLGLLTRSRARN